MSQKIVANLSGGKDSLAMCLRLIEEGEHVDDIIFIDTGMEYPETYAAIERFERETGRTVTRLKRSDGRDFIYYAARHVKGRCNPGNRPIGYGWPSALRRWCTQHVKLDVACAYDRAHNTSPLHLIGIAADEPKRIRNNPNKRYPLVEWGMTESGCLDYVRRRGYYLPGQSAYDHIQRMSCFCCPLSNLTQVKYLIRYRPVLWARIKAMEAEIGEPWKRGTAYYEERLSEPLLDGDHTKEVQE